MKKRLSLCAVLALSYAGIAAAQDQGFFAGLGVGRSNADVADITLQDVLGIGFSSVSGFQNQSSKSDTAWKLYGGYQFNSYVAAEVLYADLGKFSRSASGTGTVTSPPASLAFSLDSDLKITGFGAAALIGLPVSDQWGLFAKPGMFYWDAKRTTITTAGSSLSDSTDKKGTSPTLGLGASYKFTERLSARLEWERFFDVGDKNTTGKSDVNLYTVSVQFTP
jgi:OOP family OmpA-OmpF porin